MEETENKTVRQIIEIDENLCDGCGLCIPNCAEGALRIIDGKARLISDLFCDGLGACIGHCPQEAISVVERPADEYDERKVMEENIIPKGANTIEAHLNHLKDHGEEGYLTQALEVLKEHGINVVDFPENRHQQNECGHGCPGSAERVIQPQPASLNGFVPVQDQPSELRQWPVQLHLVNPNAGYFQGADVLLAADCVAYALGDFHAKYLRGKSLLIGCPKLDDGLDVYIEKIRQLADNARINTITILRMEVPCCGGLVRIVKSALSQAVRKVPVKQIVVGIEGNIISEEWISV